MLDQRRTAAQSETSREQLFTERYQTLLAWAMRLTHQQRESAEDLVQDAFVQFMLARTQLEEIENIDGYLRRVLRNMYISRMTRLAQRLHDTALSIADYDTFRLGWTAIEPPRRMQAAEQLHQICAYACFRKESSRAGSVLILRFFLDYFPTEIASILSSNRHCVDQWQRLARREVKVFIEDPARLRFVDTKTTATHPWARYPSSDCDLMLALRAMIFESRQGTCLSREDLLAAYTAGRTEALSTTELAHVVSCRSCLDSVNATLGLPLLEERYPAEDCSHDEPPQDPMGGGGSGGAPTSVPVKFKHQLRETREHKPSELRIAVNGAQLSSLKVSSELSELNLNLACDEPIEFIEVLSEQDVQLLFLSISDAVVEADQWAEIELSDGRILAVCFRMHDGPALHVVYDNPGAKDLSAAECAVENFLSSPLTIVHDISERGVHDRLSWARHFFGSLRNALQRRTGVAEEASPSTSMTSLGLSGQPAYVYGGRSWKSPALLVVLLMALATGGWWFYKTSLNTTPSATTLLARAALAETDRGQLANRVGHRSINLEIRRSSEGAVISRQTVESWENYDRRQRIQRLYDDGGRLLAVSTQSADGSRVVYHHHSKGPQPRGATPDGLLLDLDDVWQLTPLATQFNAIIADAGAAAVRQDAAGYVVTFEKGKTVGASRLVKATLTLARSDLHAIEQTLVVQRGDELREYKFVETKFDLLHTEDVAPGVFEIEPELAGEASASRTGDSGLRKLGTGPASSTSTTAFASAELEVDVAYLLNHVKADRSEQVTLTRSASGSLRVEGVVENAARREEFLRALGPVRHNPAVTIQIQTVAEASKQQTAPGTQSVREVKETANTIAVDDELRNYYSNRGLSGEALDEAVRTYSSRVVNHGYRALFHAVELKRLVSRFARVDMRAVAPDARSKWLEMMGEHASAYARETAALRRELQPVFLSETSPDVIEDFAISSDADLARAVERLHRLAIASNEAIGQAFTISTQSSAAAFKSTQFRRNLEAAARLSERISQYSR
ncbi:MAG TPA: RNA polymerase sigma factor [Pyrinomonadaceae bacterium]|jgi:RNA polymerase sigma factor (sigma-70 family)